MSQTDSKKPEEREAQLEELDRRLDEALKESFPASDPIAVTITGR